MEMSGVSEGALNIVAAVAFTLLFISTALLFYADQLSREADKHDDARIEIVRKATDAGQVRARSKARSRGVPGQVQEPRSGEGLAPSV